MIWADNNLVTSPSITSCMRFEVHHTPSAGRFTPSMSSITNSGTDAPSGGSLDVNTAPCVLTIEQHSRSISEAGTCTCDDSDLEAASSWEACLLIRQ